MAQTRPGGTLNAVTPGLLHLSVRRRRRLAWLVLPALLLRALIPDGFMPFAGPAGAYLGFCPGSGTLPSAATELTTHASHGGHTHHPGGTPGRAHRKEICARLGCCFDVHFVNCVWIFSSTDRSRSLMLVPGWVACGSGAAR